MKEFKAKEKEKQTYKLKAKMLPSANLFKPVWVV